MQIRPILLILVRFLPVALLLASTYFWFSERQSSMFHEEQSAIYLGQLKEAASEINTLKKDLNTTKTRLEMSRENEIQTEKEKLQLISQLGERDEHIRRLLAEMVQLLSSSSTIDLGSISIPTAPETWRGVESELRTIMSAPPMLPKSFGSPQVELEEAPMVQSSEAAPTQTLSIDTSSGEVVVVNQKHGFVVINRGLDHGIAKGEKFTVYGQGGEQVGEIVINTVYAKIAAADITSGKISHISVGSNITSRAI